MGGLKGVKPDISRSRGWMWPDGSGRIPSPDMLYDYLEGGGWNDSFSFGAAVGITYGKGWGSGGCVGLEQGYGTPGAGLCYIYNFDVTYFRPGTPSKYTDPSQIPNSGYPGAPQGPTPPPPPYIPRVRFKHSIYY